MPHYIYFVRSLQEDGDDMSWVRCDPSFRTYGDAEKWMWTLAALNARRHPNVCRGPFAEARIEGFDIASSIASAHPRLKKSSVQEKEKKSKKAKNVKKETKDKKK